MNARLRSSGGYAVPIAMIVMTMMLTIGLAAIAFVDAETSSSRNERAHESRLNLTEGVLAAQIFQLSRAWPSSALPEACTETSTDPSCPTPAQVRSHFSAVDFSRNPTWDVKVRDNGPGVEHYYTDSAVLNQAKYDGNRDGELWVRAEGRLGGTRRVVVGRVRVEQRPIVLPGAPFVAGSFNTNNNGNNAIIYSDKPGVVRCDTSGYTNPTANECVKYDNGQLQPAPDVRSEPGTGATLSPLEIEALRKKAIENNTYYQTCPPAGSGFNPTGEVVWVESGYCEITGNMKVNETTKKGVFVINNGYLKIGGSVEWWGIIYALNPQGCGSQASSMCGSGAGGGQDIVVQVTGTSTLHGGVFVEGAGRFNVGNSGAAGHGQPNLMYLPTALPDIKISGTAGIIQNTWRELLRR